MMRLPIEASRLCDYLNNSASAFHVIAYTKSLLTEAEFKELNLKDTWTLEKGCRYFCSPFDTTLYAFTIGENCDLSNPIHIGGAHVDSPTLKIKPNPEIFSHGYMQLNTEVYGGPILNTFFDRPLSLAGKIVTRGKRYDKPAVHIVDLEKPVIYLPNLAIHMNRGVNEGGAAIDRQKHLLPIVGTLNGYLNKDTTFVELIARSIDVEASDILDYDLCFHTLDKPTVVGFNEEFISAPKLDDINSVSALIHGLMDSDNKDRVNLVCLFDNEEIGSLSKQGADSQMPATILGKIWQSFGKTQIDCMSDISDGLMLSMDVAHAYHPNYPAPQDITNYPIMNKGFCFKTASNQSYSWDSEALSAVMALCDEADIPYQRFVKESNTKGGGTIGSMISSLLPMRTIDVGAGLLAMHSACELMGVQDQVALEQFSRAFFSK